MDATNLKAPARSGLFCCLRTNERDGIAANDAPRLQRAPFLYARQKHAVFLSLTSQLSTTATAVPALPKMDLQQAAA
jgi:hypothetical protein